MGLGYSSRLGCKHRTLATRLFDRPLRGQKTAADVFSLTGRERHVTRKLVTAPSVETPINSGRLCNLNPDGYPS